MDNLQSNYVCLSKNAYVPDGSIKIRSVSENERKKEIMKACDHAFQIPLFSRPDQEVIIHKIMSYALFYGAFVLEGMGEWPAGYVAFYANDKKSRVAYISNIGVHAEYQRCHIGSKLMQKSLEEAKMNGMEFMRLEVLKMNNRAVSFYRYWGFVFESKASKDTYYMCRRL